jgi:phospholipase A1
MRTIRIVPWLAVLCACASARAAEESLGQCAGIDDAERRLECYDELAGRVPAEPVPSAGEPPPAVVEKAAVAGDFVQSRPRPGSDASALAVKWELDDDTRNGVLRFRTHRPNYFLLARYTDNPNFQPASPTLGSVDLSDLRYTEAKFQLSFKTKLAQGLFDDRIDIWAAYSQQSHWQIYAPSAPFRETNYEPEVLALLRVKQDLLGLTLRMINIGFVHQSNGRGGALSRSWNRVYVQFGVERGDFSMLVRPWWRLPERESPGVPDNNPDIVDFIGRGDALLLWRLGGHSFGLLLRSNLSTDTHRGAAQLDWRFPLHRNLKGYVQFFAGYGESLVDYNWRQNTLGIGISLSDWL